ncbi:MAG: chemotaxis protein CheW [Planctomycetota bacterium]|nr:chemotaxis protein CheW [Planctomycetota bacterium]
MRETDQPAAFVHFRVGSCGLSLRVREVEMVVRLRPRSELDRPIPGVDGALPLHGLVVPLVHLSRILEIEAEEPEMAVVATAKEHQVALGVNDVIGLYESPEIETDVRPVPGLGGRGVRQIHRLEGEIIFWLDMERIISEEGWDAIRSLGEMGTDGLLGDSTLGILGYDE